MRRAEISCGLELMVLRHKANALRIQRLISCYTIPATLPHESGFNCFRDHAFNMKK